MTMANDLMGLGVSPLLAAKTSQGGIGPLTITAAGTTYAASTKIGCSQYLVSCTNGDNTKSLGLPTVGTDNGAMLADDFIINNAGTDSFILRASSGVAISAGGLNDSKLIVGIHTSVTCYPVSSTQWIGVRGS